MHSVWKIALIGPGEVGLKHVSTIIDHPKFELSSVFEPDLLSSSKDNSIQALHGFLQTCNSNLVCICTPNGLHYKHAMAALQANKHVIIEKPLSIKAQQANDMIDLARSTDRHLIPVYQLRFSPLTVWLNARVRNGTFGKIKKVKVCCRWNRGKAYYLPDGKKHNWRGSMALDGGILYNQFSHYLYLLVHLFGKPDVMSATVENRDHSYIEIDDFISADLRFDGFNAEVGFTTAAERDDQSSILELSTDKGNIVLGGQYFDELISCTIPEIKDVPEADIDLRKSFYDYVAKALAGNITSGDYTAEAYHTTELIEAIYSFI